MAVIAIASANGAPWVSTTAVGLALNWRRPVVLVDADTSASATVAAGWFRARRTFDSGLLDLVLSYRNGTLGTDLPKVMTPMADDVSFLPGISKPSEGGSLRTLWDPLASALAGIDGRDVIIDIGRLGQENAARTLFLAADVPLLAVQRRLPSLYAARNWCQTIGDQLEAVGAREKLGLLIMGDPQPYDTRETEKLLGARAVAEISNDPTSAEVYSRGETPPRRFESTRLNRSLRAAVSKIEGRIQAVRADLEEIADV